MNKKEEKLEKERKRHLKYTARIYSRSLLIVVGILHICFVNDKQILFVNLLSQYTLSPLTTLVITFIRLDDFLSHMAWLIFAKIYTLIQKRVSSSKFTYWVDWWWQLVKYISLSSWNFLLGASVIPLFPWTIEKFLKRN